VADFDARDDDKDWSGMLGLAALNAPEYWGSEDDETNAAPVIIVDYKDTAYFRVNHGGYWFYKPNDSFRVGALIRLRPGAWEDDDDSIEDLGPLPAGFDEPDAQAEPGINLKWHSGMASVSSVIARIGFEILGEDEVNYQWYGDTSGADVDSATNTSLSLIGTTRLNPSWTLFYGAKTTTLDDEIDDSPIVEEDSYTVGFVGAGWNF
jgi:outer membrane scaffolding protein for murein synthesis (MipA/OmpV family)